MSERNNQNGLTWTIREGFEDSILDNLFNKLHNFDKYPELTLVKDNNVRSVFLFRTGHSKFPEVFIKRYKCRDLQDIIKYILFPSKAASEWRTLKEFENRKLPCPIPLAFSEKRSFRMLRDSCLITEALNPAITLNEYVEHMQAAFSDKNLRQKREELTQSLAVLIRKLHQNKIFYRDLHAGNLMIQPADKGSPEIFFIDLHKAFVLPRLLQWMRIRDLAQLCNSFPASKADKFRFMKEYCKESSDCGNRFRTLHKKIYRKGCKLENRRIKSRSKRCLKKSSVFEISKAWDENYFGRRDFGEVATQKAILFHELSRKTNEASTIKKSTKSVLTIHKINNGLPLCVKGYRFLGIPYALKNLFRKSRAMKSWIAANGLMIRGIETPVPQAIVERKWGPFIVESFFITRWLQDATQLNNYVQTLYGSNSIQKKEAFIKTFAQVIQKLHRQGIYHADLKSNNILVTELRDDRWGFYLIDLDRVLFKKTISFYQRANNLAQINASVSRIITIKDRFKFFHFYARGTSFFNERKKYYRKILEISRTKKTKPYGITFR